MQKNNFPFTQIRVDKLKPADKTVVYSDTKQQNLKLSITPSGKSSYYARFKACGQSYNIRIGCVSVLTLDDARHRVIELMNYYRREAKQTSVRSMQYTIQRAFDVYFQNHLSFKPTKGNQQHSLSLNYNNHLKPIFGKLDVRELGTKLLAKSFKELGNRKGYAIHNKCVVVLKAMFNYCLEYEDDFPLEFNPAAKLKKMATVARTRYLSPKEANILITTLYENKHPVYTDMFLIALFTGARISNVKSMKWGEVKFEEKLWIVPAIKTKSKKTYFLPLTNHALHILQNRYNSRDPNVQFVFPSLRFSATGYATGGDHYWKDIIIKAGLHSTDRDCRLRQHDLRRTFATFQALAGVDIATISQTLGHADVKNTQIYAQISVGKARDAINKGFGIISS
ncbi:tyrosine-type recombinase/integrase [Alteromonas oceani]|uniref:Tyrosine-type recombinase/integrase n=1 Tax=Alteromonas oceani TaxID=2071609 RepID=A0ABV7K6J8_9ALTE|nr:site-specific integrase [Alteromonas oceani]